MKKDLLNQFRLSVNERNLTVDGVIVYKDYEGEVSHRWTEDLPTCLFSGSKTFTSVGVGIARDEGLLDLNDKVISFFPEFEKFASPGTENITIRDLLHMSSGKGVFWFNASDEENYNEDWVKLFFREKMTWKPGERFFYSNSCTYTLGRIIEKKSGKILRDYLMPRLFKPLGIMNPQWHMCPQGHSIGASALYLNTSDFQKIGKLMLHKGIFDGQRIVREEYVKLMSTDIVDNSNCGFDDEENSVGYGYQVWKNSRNNAYRADGKNGQFSIVFPEKHSVVTINSHKYGNTMDIIRAVDEDIYPYL